MSRAERSATTASSTGLSRRQLLAVTGLGTAAAAVVSPTTPAARADDPTVRVTDFGADPTGGSHAAAAFQAAIDSLPQGGTVIVPPGTYLLAGEQQVELRSNVTIEGYGATIVRRAVKEGHYAAFIGLSRGRKGRGSGVTGVTMRGLTFRGDFPSGATICIMALHHCADFLIEDCEFIECQGGAGHTFDLGGCNDITFRGCTWRGYNARGYGQHDLDNTIETIQLDISHASTMSYPDDDGSYDALGTTDVTIEDCSFLPLDLNGKHYPCPNPIGEHFVQEGQPYRGIVIRDVEILDPPSEPRTEVKGDNEPAVVGDNANARGVIHIRQAVDVLIENVTVTATIPGTTNRVLMLSSMSWGRLDTPPEIPGSRDFYTDPIPCRNIRVRDLTIDGFEAADGEDPQLNPLIHVNGVDDAAAQDVSIHARIASNAQTAVRIAKADGITLKLDIEGPPVGVDLSECTDVSIHAGSFTDVDLPVRLTGIRAFRINGTDGTHRIRQIAAVRADATTQDGRIAGTRWSGFDRVLDGGDPSIVLRGNEAT